MENETLFDLMEESKRQRKKMKYVKSKSANGELTVHLSAEVAQKVKRYCKLHALNCKTFVNQLLSDQMDELERTQYDNLSREELLELVKRGHIEL